MKELLHKMQLVLEQINPKVLSQYQNGLNASNLSAIVSAINLIFPDDLIDLYKWKNGVISANARLIDLWIFPLGLMFSIENAVEIYEKRAAEDKYWKKDMFPVFGSGTGDFFLLDLNANSTTFGYLFSYCPNDTEYEVTITYFDSLYSCINTVIDWYASDAFYIDRSKTPELFFDILKYKSIGKINNPNSGYWTLNQF